jgi:hypothetical protein
MSARTMALLIVLMECASVMELSQPMLARSVVREASVMLCLNVHLDRFMIVKRIAEQGTVLITVLCIKNSEVSVLQMEESTLTSAEPNVMTLDFRSGLTVSVHWTKINVEQNVLICSMKEME